MRNLRLLSLFLLTFFICSSIVLVVSETSQSAKERAHNQKGLQYYDEAFYQQLPKGNLHEADEFFELALAEFQEAIEANPRYTVAYRNLARLHYVRKNFLQAANAYRNVTLLEPQDIDTYVKLALCYTQIDRFSEALQELVIAKSQTENPEVIAKLDEYIRKINERK